MLLTAVILILFESYQTPDITTGKKATVAKNTISNGAVRENWIETK